MQRINLLYVITKLELGGAQLQTIALIRSLDKERFAPYLFTAKEGILMPEAVSLEGVTLKQSRFLERSINIGKDICAFFELYSFIKKNKIKIVHTHSSKAGILGRLAARLAGVKIIIHSVHGWSFNDTQPYFTRKITIMLERFAARFTDALIVVSQHDLDKGVGLGIGSAKQYRLIRYGINTPDFLNRKSSVRAEFGIDLSDCLVVNISCFKPQKSCLDYIRLVKETVKQNSRVKFLLVGDGAMRPQIEQAVRSGGLADVVRLTGWRRDIPDILAASDILVLTSLWEGLPIVVLEAMAAGLPIVATDTGGVNEVVSNGKTGFLAAPQDVVELTRKLVFLVSNPQERKAMGKAASDFLGRAYRQEIMQQDTAALYRQLWESKNNTNSN